MINELAHLAEAMKRKNIQIEGWHRKYKPIPNVNDKNPCVRLILSGGHIVRMEPVSVEMGKKLHRFGSNQGYFPGMNLQPLYRITDEEIKKELKNNESDVRDIYSWCTENNWNPKFLKKYAHSVVDVPNELRKFFEGKTECDVLNILFNEITLFADPKYLFGELEREALRLLEQKTDCALALRILFHCGDITKEKDDDCGTLSVIFDSQRLIEKECPVVSVKFTHELNRCLLEADKPDEQHDGRIQDAFGVNFVPVENPMPAVKLAGGFEVTLRTMFRGQPCQNRYGKIECAAYPISNEKRTEFSGALEWLASEEHRNTAWTNIDKNEILFAYPFIIPDEEKSCVSMFTRIKTDTGSRTFEEEVKVFMKNFQGTREKENDANADIIQIFILRKIDKARTKLIYTRTTDAGEIERRSEVWNSGKTNVPTLRIGQPETLYPLGSADVLNLFMKQDGSIVTDKYRPTPKYHGMELFFGENESWNTDLSVLVRNTEVIAPLLGKCVSVQATEKQIDFGQVRQAVSLMGFLLLELGIEKEKYMNDFAYLYGQLLKVSDELHVLYCKALRSGDIPPKLAGSSMYMSVSESPQRSLGVLGGRMNPYINWARVYRNKAVEQKGAESRRAGWLLRLYENLAGQIMRAMAENNCTHFSDAEKAQLFLGYIAAFPKNEENQTDAENGGNENE